MARPLYRNYSAWLLVAEPRVGMSGISKQKAKAMAILISAVMVFLAALLWQRMQVLKMGYDVSDLSRKRDQLLMQNTALREDLRKLYTLKRVDEVARQTLGMANADARDVVYLPDPSDANPSMARRAMHLLLHGWR